MRFVFSFLLFGFVGFLNATHYYTRSGEFAGAYDHFNPNIALIDHDFASGKDTIIEFPISANADSHGKSTSKINYRNQSTFWVRFRELLII